MATKTSWHNYKIWIETQCVFGGWLEVVERRRLERDARLRARARQQSGSGRLLAGGRRMSRLISSASSFHRVRKPRTGGADGKAPGGGGGKQAAGGKAGGRAGGKQLQAEDSGKLKKDKSATRQRRVLLLLDFRYIP